MQIYASPPIFIIIQRRNYKEKQFFFKFLAGAELVISESAGQCLIHWATAGSVNLLAAAFQSKLKVFTARFYYVSQGNATITCYEETFRELGAVQLSTSANRKRLPHENKPRAGTSSIVVCLVLTELWRMF